MCLKEPAARCPIKTTDRSHLSLQGNVIVQPLKGIQQRLVGFWNFAWAENRGSQWSEADNSPIVKQQQDRPVLM